MKETMKEILCQPVFTSGIAVMLFGDSIVFFVLMFWPFLFFSTIYFWGFLFLSYLVLIYIGFLATKVYPHGYKGMIFWDNVFGRVMFIFWAILILVIHILLGICKDAPYRFFKDSYIIWLTMFSLGIFSLLSSIYIEFYVFRKYIQIYDYRKFKTKKEKI